MKIVLFFNAQMLKLKNSYIYLILLVAMQILFSCNYKNSYFSEEMLLKHLAAEKFDSLASQVKYLNNQGTNARNDGAYKDALNLHFEALKIAEVAKDTTGQIYALNNIGTDLRRTYSNMEASSYHFLALELSSSKEEYLKSRAVAMNGLGNIFLALKKPQQARSYFRQALAIEEQDQSNLGAAINYANIAESYNMSNDLDSSLFYYEKSLEQNKIINSDIGVAICKRAMGLIFLKKGDKDLAIQLLSEAYSLMKESKDAFHKLEVQTSLAETLITLGKTP